MSYLRNACGVNWRDRWTKEHVHELYGIEVDVLRKFMSNGLRWFSLMKQ